VHEESCDHAVGGMPWCRTGALTASNDVTAGWMTCCPMILQTTARISRWPNPRPMIGGFGTTDHRTTTPPGDHHCGLNGP
jgi:hypothetical protein